ncbi:MULTISPECIES: hypothetical protein [Burkholderiaceae]|uniref:hypothetical protein n=1 Tax=Burkholderiaceae TaxID=119060 RepID=UPI0002F99416|nr:MULTISPECIES: hypothetical protein [Burkholderia]MDO5923357.1 hypothetical protein [Burkholderia cenocepacia]MDP9546014.1 hypothetical protein [Burkholderia cepacia]MDP9596302.1 hypothetical protein [Burkholderia cepacia]UTP22428.1 hypothetical protein NMB33_00725 [Burkholderia sp. FXe9]
MSSLRQAFGDAIIDKAIQRGKAGEPAFFARENRRQVGTPIPAPTNSWMIDRAILDRHFRHGCNGSCVGTGQRCPTR